MREIWILFVVTFLGIACVTVDSTDADQGDGPAAPTGNNSENPGESDGNTASPSTDNASPPHTTQNNCPPNAEPDAANPGACVCSGGYIIDASCQSCIVDTNADGCAPNSIPADTGCSCIQGYIPNEPGCGCLPAGIVGGRCDNDSACLGDFCALSLSSFGGYTMRSGTRYEGRTPLPGGYCSVKFPYSSQDNCVSLGGTYVAVRPGSHYLDVCLLSCERSEECRAGYICRPLSNEDYTVDGQTQDHTFSFQPNGIFCLPPVP